MPMTDEELKQVSNYLGEIQEDFAQIKGKLAGHQSDFIAIATELQKFGIIDSETLRVAKESDLESIGGLQNIIIQSLFNSLKTTYGAVQKIGDALEGANL